ncbi:MAG: hypothetical protein E6K60_05975 [Nitrospirae bacterium]|nr:MAG: hypothetical protein E6K60_05975 [Nitrospirota bacterium]
MRQLRLCIRKSLAIYLIMALLVLGSLPTDLMAALIPSDLDAAGLMVGADRLADIQKIQSVLESKVVAQRLTDLGLSMQEVQQSMAKLTTEELHQIATNLDGLQAGGDVGIIIAVLLVIALVLLIIFLAKRV